MELKNLRDVVKVKPLTSLTKEDKSRVRIGVSLTEMTKVLVRGASGKAYEKVVGRKAMKNVYRAKAYKRNHFHRSKWHIETDPVSWNTKTKHTRLGFTFFKSLASLQTLKKKLVP